MAEYNKDKCSFQFPSSQSCRNIAFAMLREGDGTSSPNFVWKSDWHDAYVTNPDPYCDDPLDPPPCNGDDYGNPGTQYWETGPFQLHTQFPFRNLNKITITPVELIFEFENCYEKYAALKLYPEGSQIVITMNLNDPFGYNAPNKSINITCPYARNGSSAACFYFLSEAYYTTQTYDNPLTLTFPIQQFQQIQKDCGKEDNPEECNQDCNEYLIGLTACSGISFSDSTIPLEFTGTEDFYQMCDTYYNYFRNNLLASNSLGCTCSDNGGQCSCTEDETAISDSCLCDCPRYNPGTESGFDEFGLPPSYSTVYGVKDSDEDGEPEGPNRCFFTIGTTIRVCRRSEPFRST